MTLDVEDEQVFKAFVIKKLEAISDADSEVLADYVVALVKTDEADAVSGALKDFIPDSAQTFVNEIFSAIATRSYDLSAPLSKTTVSGLDATGRAYNKSNKVPAGSRKRSYHDWDAEGGQNGHIPVLETITRSPKRTQRGSKPSSLSRLKISPPSYAPSFNQTRPSMHLPPLPTPPPGMPPFDLSNPMASFLAMQQTMGMFLGMPDGGFFERAGGISATPEDRQCHDYHTKGFCTRGTSCPYEHGGNAVFIADRNDGYEPEAPFVQESIPQTSDHQRAGGFPAVHQHSNSNERRAKGHRPSFSMAGPDRTDRSNTSIVVEQIPKDYLNEPSIQDFFSQFGKIDHIDLHYHHALAIVKYNNHKSARAAYQSPKCIFENRFVKVFWHKLVSPATNGHAHPPEEDITPMTSEQPALDLAEVAKRQEEAQKRHEATKQKRNEILEQRRALDQRLGEINLERQRAIEMLAKQSGSSVAGDDDEQTTMLKAKLAELQSEAKTLGIDMDREVMNNDSHAPLATRIRGAAIGQSRGRGYSASYRGRGGGRSVMSLDNRSKTVAITFAEGRRQDHEETLRHYLMFNGLDSASLTQHLSRDDTALIQFQQRYEGENFLSAASYAGPLAHSDLPKVIGKVKLKWHKLEETSLSHVDNLSEIPDSDAAGCGAQDGLQLDSKQDVPHREDRDMDTYDEVDEVY
ncbi:hypothetical protein LTR78_010355 [Recurvomyces mirabilis]|uniref:RNA-binding protein n=1 Tax=Recurvomyces mirabilis TaxID=574656 RepID=A0AAE0TMM1_9PEZI|nr:hypothetical protein LTR78_010355 [Recurvomyces mirabilis]KAK5156205.1 hypothetical protein LTS14_005092 [Recurvomyces mirabilis]